MTVLFRVEMFVVAIVFLAVVVRSINKNIFSFKNAFGWIILSLGILIFSIIPQFPTNLAKMFSFETTSNFLYFCAIIFLLFCAISGAITVSVQQNKLKLLIQEVSILKSKVEKEEKK